MPLSTEAASNSGSAKLQLLNSYEIRLLLAELVDGQGIALADLLAGSGVSPRFLDNPSQRLTLEQELLLYTRVAHSNRDPQLGIRVGARLSLSNYGILGYAMMAASTVQEALQLLTEFAPLVSWASHSSLSNELYAGQPCRCLTIYPTALDPVAAALEVESTMASLQAVFNDLLGEKVTFTAIEISHGVEIATCRAIEELFGCPVTPGSGRSALLLPKSLLACRLPLPQPEYSALFRDLCRQSMSALTEDRGLVAAIRGLLAQEQGSAPSLEQLASDFGQSSRTLRRHLDSLGVSYRVLLDEARYQRARRYLSSTDLTVEAIASRLGYSGARSFRTAFKRWAGATPASYRAARKGA